MTIFIGSFRGHRNRASLYRSGSMGLSVNKVVLWPFAPMRGFAKLVFDPETEREKYERFLLPNNQGLKRNLNDDTCQLSFLKAAFADEEASFTLM